MSVFQPGGRRRNQVKQVFQPKPRTCAKDKRGMCAWTKKQPGSVHCQRFPLNWSWTEPSLGVGLRASQVALLCGQDWESQGQEHG